MTSNLSQTDQTLLQNQTTMKLRPEGPDWQTKLQQVLHAAAENKFVQVATVSQE